MTNLIAILSVSIITNWHQIEYKNNQCGNPFCLVVHYDVVKEVGRLTTNYLANILFEDATNQFLLKKEGEQWPSQKRERLVTNYIGARTNTSYLIKDLAAPDTNSDTNIFTVTNNANNLFTLSKNEDNSPVFIFDTTLKSKPILFQCNVGGEMVVRIFTNANVEFGDGIKPDEAAMVFWNQVLKLSRNQQP